MTPSDARPPAGLRVGITGASGLIGTALRLRLRERGDDAVPIVRRAPGVGEIGWNPAERRIDPLDLVSLDAVVNLAGANVADRRWTTSYRCELIHSRTTSTATIAEAMAAAIGLHGRPTNLISASATGYYGDRGNELIDESSDHGSGFLSEICVAWEAATAPAVAAGINVATIRTGIVLSRDGGPLHALLPLFEFGLGGRFGNGEQWMSWISIHDAVAAIEHLLDHPTSAAVNLVSPRPVTNREFASTTRCVLRRPPAVPVPRFIPRLLLGRERADALLFESHRVVPRTLLASGFVFRHPTLETALHDVLDT
jgi:uncharacterized protein